MKESIGSAFGHAGEFLQGAINDAGDLRRILISIPAPELRSDAIFKSDGGSNLTITPGWKRKSLKAFQLAWFRFTDMKPCGTLAIQSEIPVSRGMGSSTADCVAAVRAAAAYWGRKLSADQVAMLTHQAECFSDATMYDDRLVVFQHCEGKIYEAFDGDIPNLQLLVVEQEDGERKTDTDTLTRPNYSPEEIRQFSACLTRFRHASRTNDAREIAHIATISSLINQRYHPKPEIEHVERIALSNGALGVAVAHSGDIQVLLYPPSSIHEQRLRKVSAELEEIRMKCWRVLSTRREIATPKVETPVANVSTF